MGLRINQNIAAMNSYRNLSVTDGQMSKSLEKLSSGFRINRAADDAAGLAISEKLRGQVNGLNKASENAQNGISLIQTAEGALNESHSILQRVRELAVQSANDTNGADERAAIQKEVNELAKELTRISDTTEFNGQKLLNGDFSGKQLQIGANTDQTLSISINSMDGDTLGVATTVTASDVTDQATALADALTAKTAADTAAAAAPLDTALAAAAAAATATYDGLAAQDTLVEGAVNGIDLSTAALSTAALDTIDSAIKQVSEERATLGAVQNRLEHTVNNLNVASENLAASESRIRDTDMAKEMMAFTRSQILSQAGTAMLAQANQASQGVLSLLR